MDQGNLLSKIKKINTFDALEQKIIYSNAFSIFDNFNESEQLNVLLILRTYFLNHSTLEEKEMFIIPMISIIESQSSFSVQVIELASILYKYTNNDQQELIFSTVINSDFDGNGRRIVALCYFIKHTFRVYSEKQQEIIKEKMNKVLPTAPSYLADTITSLKNDMSKSFQKRSKYLFLIPEFLNGTTFVQPPLALLNCATYLQRESSIDVDILDNRIYNYSLDKLLESINDYELIVVCSSTVDQVHNYFVDYRYVVFTKYVNAIKNTYSDKTIVVCGGHGTVRPQILLKDCNPDYIVKGEFDVQLVEVVKKIYNKTPIETLPNIIYKDNKNQIIRTPEDINVQHPVQWCKYAPNYDLIHLDCYFGYSYHNNMSVKKLNWSVVQASRGCPFSCSFCYNFFGKKVRFRDIESVVNELIDIEKRGIKEIFFLDQNFIIDKDFAKELCEKMIKAKIQIKWQCQICVNSIDIDTLFIMKKAGCKLTWLGIESFDENVRKINNKNYSDNQLIEAIETIKKAEINYNAFIMLGMMGETKESIAKTVEIIKKNKISLTKSILICTPRFDTPMYEETVRQLGKEIDCFLDLDSYKGNIKNNISEADISIYVGELLKLANNSD